MNTGGMGWNREYALSVLGLPLNADMDMVKKAYHTLCKKFHPDENKDEWALDQYLHVQQAYEFLVNAALYQQVYPTYYQVQTPFQTSSAKEVKRTSSRIIGTGTHPESEKRYESVKRGSVQKEKLEKQKKDRRRQEEEWKRASKERSEKILEQKRKREIESQVYRIMEVLQIFQDKRREADEALKIVPFPGDKEEKKDPLDNEVFARKKAYEAFRKYEERNQEMDEKRIVDPFFSFSNENELNHI